MLIVWFPHCNWSVGINLLYTLIVRLSITLLLLNIIINFHLILMLLVPYLEEKLLILHDPAQILIILQFLLLWSILILLIDQCIPHLVPLANLLYRFILLIPLVTHIIIPLQAPLILCIPNELMQLFPFNLFHLWIIDRSLCCLRRWVINVI